MFDSKSAAISSAFVLALVFASQPCNCKDGQADISFVVKPMNTVPQQFSFSPGGQNFAPKFNPGITFSIKPDNNQIKLIKPPLQTVLPAKTHTFNGNLAGQSFKSPPFFPSSSVISSGVFVPRENAMISSSKVPISNEALAKSTSGSKLASLGKLAENPKKLPTSEDKHEEESVESRTGQSQWDQAVQKANTMLSNAQKTLASSLGSSSTKHADSSKTGVDVKLEKSDAGELSKPANEPIKQAGVLESTLASMRTATDQIDTSLADNFGILRPTKLIEGRQKDGGLLAMFNGDKLLEGAKSVVPKTNGLMSKISDSMKSPFASLHIGLSNSTSSADLSPSSSSDEPKKSSSRHVTSQDSLANKTSSKFKTVAKYKAKINLYIELLEVIELVVQLGLDGMDDINVNELELSGLIHSVKEILGTYGVKNLGLQVGRRALKG